MNDHGSSLLSPHSADMTKERFEQILRGASDISRQFAMSFVTNHLPVDYRYVVSLNQSYDENPLKADEMHYSNDPPSVGDLDCPLTSIDVAQLLCRNGALPEWIDISAYKASERFTVFSLICCGRFTANADLLYYADSDFSPFGIKSPAMPPHWTYAQGRFDLNSTRSH